MRVHTNFFIKAIIENSIIHLWRPSPHKLNTAKCVCIAMCVLYIFYSVDSTEILTIPIMVAKSFTPFAECGQQSRDDQNEPDT